MLWLGLWLADPAAAEEDQDKDGYDKDVDCDDDDPDVNPGADEVCNGIDDDCDGVIDPGCDSGGSGSPLPTTTTTTTTTGGSSGPTTTGSSGPTDPGSTPTTTTSGPTVGTTLVSLPTEPTPSGSTQVREGLRLTGGIGCGCASSPTTGWLGALVALGSLRRLRRRVKEGPSQELPCLSTRPAARS